MRLAHPRPWWTQLITLILFFPFVSRVMLLLHRPKQKKRENKQQHGATQTNVTN